MLTVGLDGGGDGGCVASSWMVDRADCHRDSHVPRGGGAALDANPEAERSWTLPTRYDAGKNTDGRKHHDVTDTLGLLMVVLVTAASVQDRDGSRLVLTRARMTMPSIVLVWADSSSVRRRPLRATIKL